MGLFDGGVLGVVPNLFGIGGSKNPLPSGSGYDPDRQAAIDDRIDKLRGQLDAIPAAKPLGAEGPSYAAKAYQTTPDFAQARSRASNQANSAAQTANDALQRRAASLGGQNGGAFVKQQQQLLSDSEDKKAEAMMGIDQQEQGAKRAFDQLEGQKEFSSAESAKGRALQRESYNADLDFKDKTFRFDSDSKLAQMQLQFEQADRESQDQQFNKKLSLYQAEHSGGLLGAGGFLGTGL